MSEHLPECFSNKLSGDSRHCICEELRACEQRILSLNPIAIGALIAQRSRERALDAAREAVDSMVIETAGNSAATVEQALAAIDALREEQAPPPLPPSVGVPSKPMWPLREERK